MATIGGVRSVNQSWQVKPKSRQERPKQEQETPSRDEQRNSHNRSKSHPSNAETSTDDKFHIDDYA